MLDFELFGFIISWVERIFEISIISITWPDKTRGVFRTDSLLALNISEGYGFYLELLFIVIVGEKRYE